MTGCLEPRGSVPSITKDYEQRVLHTFAGWYQKENPSLDAAASEAYSIARDTVKGLTATQVVTLLQERPEWTRQKPEQRYDSDTKGITIGEIARRHFVKYLEHVIQHKRLQAAFLSMTENPLRRTEEKS